MQDKRREGRRRMEPKQASAKVAHVGWSNNHEVKRTEQLTDCSVMSNEGVVMEIASLDGLVVEKQKALALPQEAVAVWQMIP